MPRTRTDAFDKAYITAAAPTTTQVKTGPGVISSITINTPANTGVVTVYDNVGADLTNPFAIITSKTADPPGTLQYNVKFSNGLKIVTSVAAQNLTIAYQ